MENKNNKPVLNININKDDSSVNDFLYCWNKFGSRPNRVVLYNTYLTEEFNEVIQSLCKSKNSFTELIPSDDGESHTINDKILIGIDDNVFISYLVFDRRNENSTINEIIFFYKEEDDLNLVQEITDKLNSCLLSYDKEESCTINTISFSQNGIEMEPVDTKIDLDSIDLFYTEKTFSKVDKILKSIKKSNKGLSVLYGERGNGKTSIINYIASKLDRVVIFIPNNLIEQTINNPEFRKFIKKHHKPIIIIDDCEMLLNELFTKSNIFVNNLLQMVDGFLSDSMEVNIITIFNVDDESEIDHSLLECNNLIDVVKFEELSEEESNELSKHLGQDKKYKNKNKVIDIIKKRKSKSVKDIGF